MEFFSFVICKMFLGNNFCHDTVHQTFITGTQELFYLLRSVGILLNKGIMELMWDMSTTTKRIPDLLHKHSHLV